MRTRSKTFASSLNVLTGSTCTLFILSFDFYHIIDQFHFNFPKQLEFKKKISSFDEAPPIFFRFCLDLIRKISLTFFVDLTSKLPNALRRD